MKEGRFDFNWFVAIFFLMLGLCASTPSIHAQDNPNTITFDNKSGESALVKLIGPTGQTVEVPNGESRTVNTAAGEYYILTRYGSKPKGYKYAKGDPFTVVQTESEYSIITITLHKVIDGNYATHPISGKEFDNTPLIAERTDQPEDIKTLTPVLPPPKIQTFELPKVYELPKLYERPMVYEPPKMYELPKIQTFIPPPIIMLPKLEPIIPKLALPLPQMELPKPLILQPL